MIRGCFKSTDAVNYCTCKLISFQVKKILGESEKVVKSYLEVEVTVSVNAQKADERKTK